MMIRWSKWILGLVLLAGAVAHAAGVPARIEVKYRVSMGSMKIGEGTDVFEHDGKSYSVVSSSHTTGLAAVIGISIEREAKGNVTKEGLKPLSFVESRKGKVKRSATFDWNAKQASLTDGENQQTVPLPPNTWDATSFAWNFAFVPPGDKDLDVHITDGRRITAYRYAIIGRETLNTAIGDLITLHVKKVQDPDDKRAFDVWLAIDQHNVPVRIRYSEKDGTSFDSVVEGLSMSPH